MRYGLMLAAALCLSTNVSWAKDEPAKKNREDLQHGEAIVSVDEAVVDAPLHRKADFPWLKLSDLKKVKMPQGKFELQFDYNVVEGTPTEIVVVFKSLQGRKTRRWSIAGDKEATIRFGDVWAPVPDKVEAWIEYGGGVLNPSDTVAGYKISNSVMLGDKGTITAARKWKPEEEQAWNNFQRVKAPPAERPEGYESVEGKNLLPGMPVLVFVAGEWNDGEYLGMYMRNLIVIPPGMAQPSLHFATRPTSHVAVARRVLEQGEKSPDAFKPSIRLLPETILPLTDDLAAVPEDLKLQPGTPLRSAFGPSWNLVMAIGDVSAGQVEVRDPEQGRHLNKLPVKSLAIEKKVIEELRKPDAEAVFAKRFAELNKRWSDTRRANAHVRDYPATFPLPDGYGPLDEKRVVKTGEKFFVYWGRSWRTVTTISDAPPNGAVEINWDENGNWAEFLNRKSLFVLTAKESKIADAGNTNPGITKKPSGGYCLTLDSVQGKKFAVAKVVMEITGLDLADAKDAADEAPIMLSQSLTKEKADQFQKQLETAGAKATVRKVE